jgi:hypothetical protein
VTSWFVYYWEAPDFLRTVWGKIPSMPFLSISRDLKRSTKFVNFFAKEYMGLIILIMICGIIGNNSKTEHVWTDDTHDDDDSWAD